MRTLGFEHAEGIAEKIVAPLRGGRFRRVHAVLLALQVGHRADSDRAADHPAGVRAREATDAGGAIYEYEPDEEEILAELLPRNIAVQIFRALLENAASFYGAQMTRDGQRHPQCRRNDPQADAAATTAPARR